MFALEINLTQTRFYYIYLVVSGEWHFMQIGDSQDSLVSAKHNTIGTGGGARHKS